MFDMFPHTPQEEGDSAGETLFVKFYFVIRNLLNSFDTCTIT